MLRDKIKSHKELNTEVRQLPNVVFDKLWDNTSLVFNIVIAHKWCAKDELSREF
jgi:hypothetical protein